MDKCGYFNVEGKIVCLDCALNMAKKSGYECLFFMANKLKIGSDMSCSECNHNISQSSNESCQEICKILKGK